VKFVSFDIEIAKTIPDGVTDWDSLRPLGISCAATLRTGAEHPRTWHGGLLHGGGGYAPKMDSDEVKNLVRYLEACQRDGYSPLTWNGLGFDFKILAEESGMFDECRELALSHTDMMFHFFCIKGFPIGLDAACHGMGLAGKPEGMNGAIAPQAWAEGRYQEVLDYVAGDVVEPLRLAELIERRGWLTWWTKRGNPANVIIPRLLTVREAMELPLPDTSWMTDPWPRSKFYGWTEQ
jgi:hypothetical protein